MFTTNNYFPTRTDDPQVIQATALYEDLAAGLRAKNLVDSVQSSMDVPAQIELDLWRFDWLRERSLSNIALSSARDSTLLFVSSTSGDPLPLEMERWISAWVREREDHQAALVLLLADKRNRRSRRHPLRSRLERAAREKGVDFFFESLEPREAGEITSRRLDDAGIYRPMRARMHHGEYAPVDRKGFDRLERSVRPEVFGPVNRNAAGAY